MTTNRFFNLRIKYQVFILAQIGWLLRWSRALFLVSGVLILGYVCLALLDARRSQADQSRRFDEDLERIGATSVDASRLHPPPSPQLPHTLEATANGTAGFGLKRLVAVREGVLLGRIEIRAVGLSAMMAEGVSEETLQRGVGHIPGTRLPGEQGNVGLAGHRDSFFRGLRKIRINDEIKVQTLVGVYRYRVDSTKVVNPEEIEVLADTEENILTLVTCYPFKYIGSAPRRFIVRATKVLE